jgi:hypothetical protein
MRERGFEMEASGQTLATLCAAVPVALLAAGAAVGAVRQRYAGGRASDQLALVAGALWWGGSAIGLFALLAFVLILVVLLGGSTSPDGPPPDGADFRRVVAAAALLAVVLTARDLRHILHRTGLAAERAVSLPPGKVSRFSLLLSAVTLGPAQIGTVGRNSAYLGAFAGPLFLGFASGGLVGHAMETAPAAVPLDVFLGFWLGPFTLEALARPHRPREAAALCLIGGNGGLLAVGAALAIAASAENSVRPASTALVAMTLPLTWSAALAAAGFALRRIAVTGLTSNQPN